MMMRDIRLGDDIDDFCVRCKRVMNHNVVSVLNGQAAKVRCRTCHSDHDFRHEQAPPPKVDARKAALFNEVLKKVAPGDVPAVVDDAELEISRNWMPNRITTMPKPARTWKPRQAKRKPTNPLKPWIPSPSRRRAAAAPKSSSRHDHQTHFTRRFPGRARRRTHGCASVSLRSHPEPAATGLA